MEKKYKEIGGYFEFENLVTNEYHKDSLKFSSARNCLRYIIRKKNIKKIYLPVFLCQVVGEACEKEELIIDYYNIDEKFNPILDRIDENSYVYIVNYYGLVSNQTFKKYKNKYVNIIIDNTHAFFRHHINNVDTIYNCRKYLGVPDGAYLHTNLKLSEDIKKGYSRERFEHLIGRYENGASDYYDRFCLADESFRHEDVLAMSNITENILGAIDYSKVKKTRKENFKYLESNLRDINNLDLSKCACDYMYPLYINNGNSLRKHLIKNKVYIPILWPNVLEQVAENTVEYSFANCIIPLPIDQRYTINDMNYIIMLIKDFLKGDSR